MYIENLELKNFRRFKTLSLLPFTYRNVIIGQNGSGKTTIVEACSIALCGKSFRTGNLVECICEGEKYFFIRMETTFNSLDRSTITYGLDRNGQWKITKDGELISRRLLLGSTSFVLCTHDDMEMIGGPPKKRRTFLDRVSASINREYIDIFSQYLRYVKQKTALLKRKREKEIVHLNKAAVPFILAIREQRLRTAEEIVVQFSETMRKEGFDLSVEIRVPSEGEEETYRRLQERISREIEKQVPLYGPHLDDVRIAFHRASRRSLSSSGEIAFGIFCLRIAEALLITMSDQQPVFIADEIYTFMDNDAQRRAIALLKDLPLQTVVTAHSDLEIVKEEKETNIIRLDTL